MLLIPSAPSDSPVLSDVAVYKKKYRSYSLQSFRLYLQHISEKLCLTIQMDDHSLVKSVLKGNQQAFEFLIKKYEKLVFHMIQKLTSDPLMVEELAQDIFMKVYEKLPGFRFNSKLSTWIATIAYRHTINALKKSSKMSYRTLEEASEEQFFKESVTPQDQLESLSTSAFVQKHIEQLPAHYKNILYLYHIEEMSYPEIVEITGMPEGTVKNYLFRARKLLKEELAKFMHKEELL